MLNPGPVLESLGPWALLAIAVVIFVESGLLFPFLPGDSLLVSGGLLHERLGLSIAEIAIVGFVAAVAGNVFGTRLFKDHARVLTTTRLRDTEAFFDRYGGRAIVLARFIPILRTYVPLAAGAGRYRFRRFLVWNAVGALLWAVGVTILGSLLGGVPFIADNLEVILAAVIIVSVLPLVIDHFRKRAKRKKEEQGAVAE
jgi:membrane-associated protein